MIKKCFFAFFLCLFWACKDNTPKPIKKEKKPKTTLDQKFTDEQLVLNDRYAIGDVRRYGIFPDSTYTNTHPVSKKSKLTSALDLAENQNIKLFFPKGFYRSSLNLNGRRDMELHFDQASFYNITLNKNPKTNNSAKNITLKGSITTFNRLGMTEAEAIRIDTVFIKTDTLLNNRKMRSRGCHIYYGSKNISIDYLEIDDLGSGDQKYKNSYAALAVDGWQNNPENVSINTLYIKSSDRHGIYLTGQNHSIKKIIIDRFGIGTDKGMTGMQDTGEIEYKLFAGIWINRCYNSTIGSITINNLHSKGFFTANFDEGDSLRPVKIDTLRIKNFDRKLPVRFDKGTGVTVKEIIK